MPQRAVSRTLRIRNRRYVVTEIQEYTGQFNCITSRYWMTGGKRFERIQDMKRYIDENDRRIEVHGYKEDETEVKVRGT